MARDHGGSEGAAPPAGQAPGERGFPGRIGPDGFYGSGWDEAPFVGHGAGRRRRGRRRSGRADPPEGPVQDETAPEAAEEG